MGKGKGKVSFGATPSAEKSPKFPHGENSNRETPCWQLGSLDIDGPFGWRGISADDLIENIHSKLRNLESMTWGEITKASGGPKEGTNSHDVELVRLSKEARIRLQEIKMDDVESLFSLRLQGEHRIWGIRAGRVLKVIWFDQKHAVCPKRKS